MTQLSAHFSDSEFQCPCCGKAEMNPEHIRRLQELRELCGYPIRVTSGYRCQAHNSTLQGSSPTSKHMLGLAADICPAEGQDLNSFIETIRESNLFAGVGIYRGRGFVHVDSRDLIGEPAYSWQG